MTDQPPKIKSVKAGFWTCVINLFVLHFFFALEIFFVAGLLKVIWLMSRWMP